MTRPRKLERDLLPKIPPSPGVYQVLPPEGQWAGGIPRICGVDKRRTLAFGQSKNLHNRLRELRRCLRWPGGHHEGNLIRKLNEYCRRFKVSHVMVCWQKVCNENEAKEKEEQLIKKYVRQFGEVPPLNAAIPRREGRW